MEAQMDNQTSGHPASGLIYAGTSIVSMILGWVGLHSVHQILQLCATAVSICAGIMAIRHYYKANPFIKK